MLSSPEIPPDFFDLGVIIAAGGAASRFGGGRNKLLCELQGLPVICHCLRTFLELVPPSHLVVVIPPDQDYVFRQAFDRAKLDIASITCVAGGGHRQDSVANGLRNLPSHLRLVAVQDAARPWASAELLSACVASVRRHGSGVAARRVVDTIKLADSAGLVGKTLNRDLLWATETPQVFQRQILETAYRQVSARGMTVTDDAQAVEMAGFPVYLVEHKQANPKITYADDLEV